MALCIHCKKEITRDNVHEQWKDPSASADVGQYCWIDPVLGSQLHETSVLSTKSLNSVEGLVTFRQ